MIEHKFGCLEEHAKDQNADTNYKIFEVIDSIFENCPIVKRNYLLSPSFDLLSSIYGTAYLSHLIGFQDQRSAGNVINCYFGVLLKIGFRVKVYIFVIICASENLQRNYSIVKNESVGLIFLVKSLGGNISNFR